MNKAEKQAQAWNEKHAVGTNVLVRKDLGDVLATKTRSEAYVLGGHTAVIMVDGITGCYDLSRVRSVEAS